MDFLGPQLSMAVAMTPLAVASLLKDGVEHDTIRQLLRSQDIICERTLHTNGMSATAALAMGNTPLASSDSTVATTDLTASTSDCLGRLQKRLPSDSAVTAILSETHTFTDATPFAFKPIHLRDRASSKDLRAAHVVFAAESARRLDLLETEEPLLPWRAVNKATHLAYIKTNGAGTHYLPTAPEVALAHAEFSRKKRMLLHVCCGPDVAGVIPQLKDEFELTCFWYDPNIQPRAEHDKRLEAFLKVMEIEQLPVIIGEYDVEHFYDKIEGLEHTPEKGAKCSPCYDMRLARAAQEAARGNFDSYSTTLAISPHKVQEKLKNFGLLNFKKYGVPYYARNFSIEEGFKQSVEYTTQHNIYRQDYCGCYFSLAEGGPQAQRLAAELGLTKNPSKGANPFRQSTQSDSPTA